MPAAITSVGAVTAHGLGCERLLAGVLKGRCAIGALTRFSAEGLCSSLAAESPSDEALLEASASLRPPPVRDRASRLLLAAAAEALAGRELLPTDRRAVVVGTTKGALELAFWEDLLSAPALALAAATSAKGPVLTTGAACASSTVAIGEALALVEDGCCDEVIVGGTDALHAFVYRGFHALKALSAAPAAPFDINRSGLSLGEGAAVIVVESLDHAQRARRAPIVTLEGFGASTDGFDQTAPDPTGAGLAAAALRALERAGVDASAVDRYHAHGTGTVQNDRMEAAVHARLFAERPVPVCCIKGSIGHTLGASGALDVVACALTLQRQVLPPVANLKEIDPSAWVPAVLRELRPSLGGLALVANAGFGGLNAALVLRRPGPLR